MFDLIDKFLVSKFEDVNSSSELTNFTFRVIAKKNKFIPKFCERSLKHYYNELIILSKKQIQEIMTENKYKLKKDVLIYVNADCQHYSVHNLTDKKAAELLEKGILKENQFDVIPEKEVLAPTPAPAPEKTEPTTAAEIIAFIKISESIEEIEKYLNDDRKTVIKAANKRIIELS